MASEKFAPVEGRGDDGLRVLLPHLRRVIVVPLDDVLLHENDDVTLAVAAGGADHHLGDDQVLKKRLELLLESDEKRR